MDARKDKLNRLAMISPCLPSWEAGPRDGSRRHGMPLVQGDRQVFDFRSPDDWIPRRTLPLAAVLLAAFLGLGPATAQPASKESNLTGTTAASLRGVVSGPEGHPLAGFEVIARNTLGGEEHRTIVGEDGGFAFDDLDAGVYDVEATLAGFTIAPRSGLLLRSGESAQVGMEAQPGAWETLEMGGESAEAEPLRQLFEESDLVVLGTVDDSDEPNDLGEVATDLRLDLVLKGREGAQDLRIYHSEREDVGGDRFAPGTPVLAFLKPRTDGTYDSVDASFGLRSLTDAERSAYRERIESLIRLPRDPQLHPDDLMEWLVATAEEPLTRKAAAGEILAALDSLGELARQRGTSEGQAASDLRSVVARRLAAGDGLEAEPSPAMIAAFLSDEQRDRLSRALRKSATLDRADLTLYEIVKAWDRPTALSWFVRQLRDVDPAATEAAPADIGVQIMEALAKELGNRNLQALVKGAQDQLIQVYSDPASFGSAPAERLRETREAEVAKKLLFDFRQTLAAPL